MLREREPSTFLVTVAVQQSDDGSWLDFSGVSDVQLEMLVNACGEHEMIQKTKFSSSFDVHGTDILEHIQTNLFCGEEGG